MASNQKRTLVAILPEWEGDLDRLKREVFYNSSKAEMIRQMIAMGIEATKAKLDAEAQNVAESN
jgi:hypothetical protein